MNEMGDVLTRDASPRAKHGHADATLRRKALSGRRHVTADARPRRRRLARKPSRVGGRATRLVSSTLDSYERDVAPACALICFDPFTPARLMETDRCCGIGGWPSLLCDSA